MTCQPNISSPPAVPMIRHSDRIRTRPVWWTDFRTGSNVHNVCASPLPFTSDPSTDLFDLQLAQYTFDPNSQGFVAFSDVCAEPHHYYQAVKDQKWIEAMDKEIAALESNNTWTMMHLPPGKKTIACK